MNDYFKEKSLKKAQRQFNESELSNNNEIILGMKFNYCTLLMFISRNRSDN